MALGAEGDSDTRRPHSVGLHGLSCKEMGETCGTLGDHRVRIVDMLLTYVPRYNDVFILFIGVLSNGYHSTVQGTRNEEITG